MTNHPGSTAITLSRDISNHCPCLISISTEIPKAKIFRFENYWMMREEFMQIMENGWNLPNSQSDVAKKPALKFKNLRRALRDWQSSLQSLTKTIENNKMLILLLDSLEEFRDLSLEEWNARNIFQSNIESLLQQQKEYWKQTGKIK
jgi:hypothetical protein